LIALLVERYAAVVRAHRPASGFAVEERVLAHAAAVGRSGSIRS
jgi:hypothetical protein